MLGLAKEESLILNLSKLLAIQKVKRNLIAIMYHAVYM